ncbi:MAG: 50S ribosomal protein L11 methyltransferase [Lachnospiraceae bacterium]|nr:50S ribosomal protein L11 methyltransferase [Lachnospiraceae bacterium]
MKWTRLTIKTTTEAEDIIISDMYELGLWGAQIEDHVPLTSWEKEQMFVDILPDFGEDDGRALLHFFVEVAGEGQKEQDAKEKPAVSGLADGVDNSYSYVTGENVVSDLDGLIAQMKQKLSEISEYMDIGEGTIEVSETEDTDWANNWKTFFQPFAIDDLLIVPSWIAVKRTQEPAADQAVDRATKVEPSWKMDGDTCIIGSDQKLLRIDPGSAFGTGMHETTQLCIRALKEYVTDTTTLLDVGTGSGILGIVALLQGAQRIVGTDLDICAKEAVFENLKMNDLSRERFSLMIGNIINEEEIRKQAMADSENGEGFDIVVANILAQVLCPLTPVAADCMKKGGIYITSGILEGKEESVSQACEQAGLEVVSVRSLGEWRCVVARKPL